jgi:hypothetical protein
MAALAEIHEEGQGIYVKRLWSSSYIAKENILGIDDSFLEGIGALRLRYFDFPVGKVYFVREWSGRKIADNSSSFWSPFVSAAFAALGFFGARLVGLNRIRVESHYARPLAVGLATILCFLFFAIRKKNPSFANVTLYAAAFIIGCVC